jgi:hypothetical protein
MKPFSSTRARTVYPATAAAAPFLCQIALDPASLWRATLVAELASLATGYDEPFAPAGTARAGKADPAGGIDVEH